MSNIIHIVYSDGCEYGLVPQGYLASHDDAEQCLRELQQREKERNDSLAQILGHRLHDRNSTFTILPVEVLTYEEWKSI